MTERADPREFGLTRRSIQTPAGETVVWQRVSAQQHRTIGIDAPTGTGTEAARPPLVLLHGAAGSWTTFAGLLRAADAEGRELGVVLAFDLPGFGASTARLDPSVTIDAVADAVELGVRSFGYDSARLVGHSMGGLLALHLAARRETIAASVLAISPSSSGVIAAVDMPRDSLRHGLRALVLLRLGMRLLAPIDGPARRMVRAAQRIGLVRLLSAPLFRHPLRAPGFAMQALADDLRPHSFTRAADALRGYAMAGWRSVACPVAIVVGDHDVFIASDDVRKIAELVPHATVAEVADCGHFPHVEHPSAVLAQID